MALGLLALGCSSTADTSSDPAAAFAGTWTFTTGMIDPMCSGLGDTLTPFDLTGDTLTINRVTSTQVQAVLTGTGVMCDVNFNVSGTTATAASGSSCAFPITLGGSTTMVPVTITNWTLNVSGGTLTMSMAGSASISIVTCTPSGMGTATRLADGGASGG